MSYGDVKVGSVFLLGLANCFCLISLFSQQNPGTVNAAGHFNSPDTTRARLFIEQADTLIKAGQFQDAIRYLQAAEKISKPLHHTRLCIEVAQNLFSAFNATGQLDSALIYAKTDYFKWSVTQ